MGKLLDFEKASRDRVMDRLINQFGTMYQQADGIANDYFRLMMENPINAMDRMSEFISKARDINEVPECYCGGPNHDWTAQMMDILGLIYPELERDNREKGLRNCLDFLDGLNYFYSQNHVELISEPWLVSDIVINRGLYWCGYKQYCDLAEQNKTWKDFSEKMESAKSAFWLAMAITRPEHTSLEIRKNFYEQFPTLMDRTKDAIATITAVHSEREAKEEGLKLEDCIDKRLPKYDTLLHDDIRKKIKEAKWILLAGNH